MRSQEHQVRGRADHCKSPACLLGEMGPTEGCGQRSDNDNLQLNRECWLGTMAWIRAGGKGTRDRWAVLAVPGTKEGARACFEQIRKLQEQQTFREAKQEFRCRQIKSEMPTRFQRTSKLKVVSGEQHRLQITSCKSSARRWYLKQWGQMRSLS